MKKFFLKLMIFFVIVAAIDVGYGFYCDLLLSAKL